MRELVVTRKRHLERQTECLDEHNRHGAGGRADGEIDERVLATILGRDLVDHEDGEDGDKEAIEEEPWECLSVLWLRLETRERVPGWIARFKISSTDDTSLSGGACRTMMTDPIKHIAQPIFPSSPNCSSRKYDPSTAPMSTDSAPSGVTRIAGAKAYAAKLNISPSTTASSQPSAMSQ